jgi:hypothetical protein
MPSDKSRRTESEHARAIGGECVDRSTLMTEPTEEEIEAVAKAICNATGEFSWEEEHGTIIGSQFYNEAIAAIRALDEHRAAAAPNHKDDF